MKILQGRRSNAGQSDISIFNTRKQFVYSGKAWVVDAKFCANMVTLFILANAKKARLLSTHSFDVTFKRNINETFYFN